MHEQLSNQPYVDPFSKVISGKPKYLFVVPKRYQFNGKTFDIDIECMYKHHIFTAIFTALQSEWFSKLGKYSVRSHMATMANFVPWLNNHAITPFNKYDVLTDFQTKRINEENLKPQSTGINLISILLSRGLDGDHIESELMLFIDALLKNTIQIPNETRVQETLNTYFTSIPWLRNAMDEIEWLKLESPKRLMDSFSITIATVLIFLVNEKKKAKEIFSQAGSTNLASNKKQTRKEREEYSKYLFLQLCKFEQNGDAANNLTQLVILDIVSLNKLDLFSQFVTQKWLNGSSIGSGKFKKNNLFSLANLFAPSAWDSPSIIEQTLFAWLCAWMTVQPYDVFKLKKNDFVLTKGQDGQFVSLQCVYYKSRSRDTRQPFMLDANQIEGKAAILYLEQFPDLDSMLLKGLRLGAHSLSFGIGSVTEILARLLTMDSIKLEILRNLQTRKSSPIFIHAYEALYEKRDYAFIRWHNKHKRTNPECVSVFHYRNMVEYPLPQTLFGLNSIKNSSIHSRTDKYRDSDLTNVNSHTSNVEKHSYLTDRNKEWVNQHGRITRMVLEDIESYIFKPNLSDVANKAKELILRTRVISVLDEGVDIQSEIQINAIGRITSSSNEIETKHDDILVLNTEETVVNMLHYINQVETKRNILINEALAFFELTALPTVEWMESLLLNKFTANTVHQGKVLYESIRGILPPLFENEIRAGVGS